MTRRSLQVYRTIVYFLQKLILEAQLMYVVDYLRNQRVAFETFLHSPASSATRLASRLHVPGRNVAKSVLVKARGAFLLTILPATSEIEPDRLGRALGLNADEIRLATADEIERVFHDCEPGAIPPFGRLYGLPTVVDSSLQSAGVLVFRTNTRHLGIRMEFRDYLSLEEPILADFGRPVLAASKRRPHGNRQRRAG